MADENIQRLLLGEIDAVYRLAYHLSACSHDADDFVQETYLRALKAADRFQLHAFGPRPWLFKILHNVVMTRYKTAQRQSRLQAELSALGDRETEAVATPHGLVGLKWDDVDERLKGAIGELPPLNRMTFLLHAVEGLKYREIADVTDVPVGTVMSRLSRARVALLEKLHAYAAQQGWHRPTAETPADVEAPNPARSGDES